MDWIKRIWEWWMKKQSVNTSLRWVMKQRNDTKKSLCWKVSRYLTHTPYKTKTGLKMTWSGKQYCMEMHTSTLLGLRVVIHINHWGHLKLSIISLVDTLELSFFYEQARQSKFCILMAKLVLSTRLTFQVVPLLPGCRWISSSSPPTNQCSWWWFQQVYRVSTAVLD